MIEDFVNIDVYNEKMRKSEEPNAEFLMESTADAILLSHIVEKGDVRGLYKAVKEIIKNSHMKESKESSAKLMKAGKLADLDIYDESTIERQKKMYKAFSKERMLTEYMKVYLGALGVVSDK